MFAERSGIQKLLFLKAALAGGGSAIERTATGNPLTFSTDLARPLKSLLIPFTPQQSGTGDPSPSNIRSILPWDGLSVKQEGKNLVSCTIGETRSVNGIDYVVLSDGGVNCEGIANGTSYGIESKRTTLPNGMYTFSVTGATNVHTVIVKNNAYYREINGDGSTTFTLTEETVIHFYIMFSSGAVANETVYVQLEVGDTATAYEPYKPITDTDIVFPSPVYGGTLDVVSGVLTVTHVRLEVKKRDFLQQGQGEMSYRQTPNNYIIQHKPKSGVNWSMARQTQKMECAVIANPYSETTFGNYIGVCLCDVTIPTTFRISTDVYDSMQNDDDSVSICYEVAEPFEIQLTPAQITALVGDNTIWSDADGSMTAVYLVSEAYAEDHPLPGGLGSGLLGGGFGSGSEDPGEDPGQEEGPDPEEGEGE